ncbi:hypothetical protein MPSEU_000673900 [Mayamaea pseudoterrestris]|nr:hypothetical protein MPSEU_000673900 [Mayamaea pseudoterrestris]
MKVITSTTSLSRCMLVLTAATLLSSQCVLVSADVPFIRSLTLRGGAIRPRSPNNRPSISVTATSSKHPALTDRKSSSAATTNGPPATTTIGGASISNEIFNLAKAVVGVGVLSLPAGIAAFGDSPSALIPALGAIALIGVLSAYGFYLIGKVCAYTGATSYKSAWERSVGPSTSWIPAWSTMCKTFLACLAYSMVLADVFTSILTFTDNRTQVLLGVTVLALLPLCWLKNLSSLAPFSLLGILGMAFTAISMSKRYLDGSYALNNAAASLLEQVPKHLQPQFGSLGWRGAFSSGKSLILVCMLSTAYMAHFNAPKFYLELQNNTLARYRTVVASSFGISIVLMSFITAIGFLTFGKASAGLILNNYASTDSWMQLSRIAVAVALLFSYPLAFQGCRDGVLDLLNVSPAKRKSDAFLNATTVVLLSALTLLAATLKDVSFVLAFGGATLGNLLTYVYPALMYRSVVNKMNLPGEGLGVTIAMLSALLGIVMGGIGANMALKK